MDNINISRVNPIPAAVGGVSAPIISLNTADGGRWRFLFKTISDIPAPTADNQDYDFTPYDNADWSDVHVPGELAMQGFDIVNNNEYYYRGEVAIPADYAGNRIYLCFDGVYSNARVWINGRHLCSHVGGFTTWQCDITDSVTPGETALVYVGVADLDYEDAGIYNPGGARHTGDSAWASVYAHHNVGGILRDAYLIAVPDERIADLYAHIDLSAGCVLNVDAELSLTSDANLHISLTAPDGSNASEAEVPAKADASGLTKVHAEIAVSNPKLWDSEHPYLYALEATLETAQGRHETCRMNVGLREITYSGKNGTDRNKVYVNGQPVKLRGVCRHDVSLKYGRSVTREQVFNEVRTYKEHNINFIRTSHYPPTRHLLDACDQLGMYVEEENAVCFKGANDVDVYCEPEEMLSQFVEMTQRDRSRACVIIWSLGNESGYKNTRGFDMEYRYIKQFDTTRPVIFSYPNTVEENARPYDIMSCHYMNVNSRLGNSVLPMLHDEFAHIPCYNTDELRRDLNVNAWWGNSIRRGWERIWHTDGALGCALWCVGDDLFFLPDGIHSFVNGHPYDRDIVNGRAIGYGQWGCVFDVFMRLKPEAFMTRKAYSPIRLDEKQFFITGGALIIPVENWFNHTNMSELKLFVSPDGKAPVEYPLPDIAPGARGLIQLQGDWANASALSLKFEDKFGFCIDEMVLRIKKPCHAHTAGTGGAVSIQDDGETIRVSGDRFHVLFDRKSAGIREAVYDGETLICGGPYFVISPDLSKDKTVECLSMESAMDDNRARIRVRVRQGDTCRMQYTIFVYPDAHIETAYLIESFNCELYKNAALSRIGIGFALPGGVQKVSWAREGMYESYPADHIGRLTGEAYIDTGMDTKYGDTPACTWKDSMKDYFLFDPNEPAFGAASRDFMATRENIYDYDVHFANRNACIGVEACGDVSARVDLKACGAERDELLIIGSLAYPSLSWGNEVGFIPTPTIQDGAGYVIRLKSEK